MNNVTTFDNFPPFATNGSRNMNTESAKYAVGFLEGETFPAEWANYLFHGATKGISDLNTAVQSIWKENINVIQGSGQTPSSSDNTQLKTAIELMIQNAVLTANSQVLAQAKLMIQNAVSTANAQVLEQAKLMIQNAVSTANAQVLAQAKLDAHPVGSLYWSSDPTNPSTLFGGTWTQIKDRFIWAKGDSDTVNAMGGSATVQLTESNLPAHTHSMNHNHTGSVSGSVGKTDVDHKHDFSWTGSHGHGIAMYNNSGRMAIANCYGSSNPSFTANPLVYTGYDSSRTYYYPLMTSTTLTVSGTTGYSNNTKSSLDHSHSWSGSVTIDSITANTGSVGSGTAHENMPPYIVKFCWERTA